MAKKDPPQPDREPDRKPDASGSARERDLIAQAFEGISPPDAFFDSDADPEATTAPDRPAADLPPPGTFPGYELVREIHRGGQGVVYLAIQLTTKRRVAIKLMHGGAHVGSAGRARFEREVQILGQLEHPNIVAIHDSGTTSDGSWFYVMDYISGRPLDEIIASSDKPSIAETLRLFGLICDAVGAAHLRGVIHRDLKPANVRINRSGEPIVVDFGLAKIAVPDVTDETTPRMMTATGQFIGSLPWASPEQAEGSPDKIDIRTDVYSLGVMLFQMLTGRFPYQVIGNMRDVLDNIMRAEPARPSTVRKKINDEVETIVLKCLSKDRQRRYQSAIELARDVHLYLAGEPIEAKRDSGWYVVKKTFVRHKFVAGVVVGFVVLMVGFGIAMSFMYAQAESARQTAQARLVEVLSSRSMVHQLLGEFSDQIRDLRGATRAREIFAEQVKEHLQRLESQAADDPAYLRDLALALDLMGDVQGAMFAPNLGETDEALAAYTRAQTIRQGLVDQEPENLRNQIDLAISLGKLASIDRQRGEYEAELTKRQQAVELCEDAVALATQTTGTPRSLLEANDARTRARVGEADARRRLARESSDAAQSASLLAQAKRLYEEAAAYWQDRAQRAPSDATFAREHAICQSKLAQLRIDAAVTARRSAQSLVESDTAQAISNLEAARTDLLEAATSADAGVAPLRTLTLDHPASGLYRRDLLIVLDHAGKARSELAMVLELLATIESGKESIAPSTTQAIQQARQRALESFQEMLAIAIELASADAASVENQRDLALAYNKVGTAQLDLDDTAAASDAFTRSLEIRHTLVRTDPTRRHRYDLAVGLLKLADLTETVAMDAPANDRASALRVAERMYVEAAGVLNAMVADELLAPDFRTIRVARDALAACRKRIADLDSP
jgi:tetratricopeptide (TPR) repeat protein/predicted Ser/Thr protein kinase